MRTRSLHDEVDDAAAAFDLTTAEGVAALLRMFARGVDAVEAGLEAAGVADELAEWGERRRSHLFACPHRRREPQRFCGRAEIWGGLYVLEGSRLGARVLAKRSPFLRTHPYFTPDATPFWPAFLQRLRVADATIRDREAMAIGARNAFAGFIR